MSSCCFRKFFKTGMDAFVSVGRRLRDQELTDLLGRLAGQQRNHEASTGMADMNREMLAAVPPLRSFDVHDFIVADETGELIDLDAFLSESQVLPLGLVNHSRAARKAGNGTAVKHMAGFWVMRPSARKTKARPLQKVGQAGPGRTWTSSWPK